MKFHIQLEMMLRIIKITSSPMLGWPLSPESTRIAVLRRRILWVISLLILMTTFPAIAFNIYQHKADNIYIFLNTTDIIAASAQGMIIFVCHIEAKRLQGLIVETELIAKKATKEEMAVIEYYMEKCTLLHIVVILLVCSSVLTYVVAPAFLSQPFPAKTAYPFSIEPLWLWGFIYCLQSIAVTQVGSSICMTLLFVTMTWLSVARFHLLCVNIEKATNQNEVRKCVRQHQETLDFADRLSTTVGRVAVVIAASNLLGVTFAGLAITYRQFYSIDFAKLMLFMTIAMVHLFLYAWPADYLAEMSQQVSESILYGQWAGKSHRMHSSMLIMTLRAAKPVVIKVDGLLPALNLETFGTGLSTAFSYIATLLAVFGV